jgi:hypothetical protein
MLTPLLSLGVGLAFAAREKIVFGKPRTSVYPDQGGAAGLPTPIHMRSIALILISQPSSYT